MPLNMRQFYLQELADQKKKEQEASKSKGKGQQGARPPAPTSPAPR